MYPSFTIERNGITAEICPPDRDNGFYRGTRFDWSGNIISLKGYGHRWVEPWFDTLDPLRHDCICGPADVFCPIGYDSSAREFLTIGVGILENDSRSPYDWTRAWKILDAGKWETFHDDHSATFIHTLVSPSYTYRYRKVMTLLPENRLLIEYLLENDGTDALDCLFFNHNFFTLDSEIVGPDVEITFPFKIDGHWREPYDFAHMDGNGIIYDRDLRAGETVYMGDLHPDHPLNDERYGLRIVNHRTDCGYKATGSGRLDHMVLWSVRGIVCIEPYIPINVESHGSKTWRIEYQLI